MTLQTRKLIFPRDLRGGCRIEPIVFVHIFFFILANLICYLIFISGKGACIGNLIGSLGNLTSLLSVLLARRGRVLRLLFLTMW